MVNPIDFVKSCPPFDNLREEQLTLLEQTLVVRTILPGAIILKQDGAPSAYLFLIQEGVVRLFNKGEEVTTLEAGDSFGYPSMILRNPPNYDIISGGHVVLYGIPEETFHKLVENHAVAEFYLKDLSRLLRETSDMDSPFLGSDLARPVETLANRAPVVVPADATVQEVAQIMREQGISSVLVQNEQPTIITIKTLCNRVLAEGFGAATRVAEIETQPVRSLPAHSPIYSALLAMLEERTDHIALTQGGQVSGIITGNDLLRYQAKSPQYLLVQLDHLEDTEGMANYSGNITRIVQALFGDGLQVEQIGRIVASLNDTLIKRLLKLVEEDLGPPPTPYAWLVFGSEGRMEQTLLTDQDNALIYHDDTPAIQAYFSTLAERTVSQLIQVGFPPCPGGYMATRWCYPLSKWEQLFRGWIDQPEPQALLEAATFFDFRIVHGELDLSSLTEIISQAQNQSIFLAHLARTALEFNPPLGFFRGIRDEDGQVDLKKGGIAPIVALARVYAVQASTPVRPTIERLEAAIQAGLLSQEGATALAEAFRYLLHLRLREQLGEIEAGQTPDNKIDLDQLLAREKRHLKESFVYIRNIQDATALNFRTNKLG